MADPNAIRTLLERVTRLAEVVRGHRRNQRVLRCQDLDLRIGDRLFRLRFLDNRHDLSRVGNRRGLEEVRNREESSGDGHEARNEANDRLKPRERCCEVSQSEAEEYASSLGRAVVRRRAYAAIRHACGLWPLLPSCGEHWSAFASMEWTKEQTRCRVGMEAIAEREGHDADDVTRS